VVTDTTEVDAERDRIVVTVPWGLFGHRPEDWRPNPLLSMTEEEQRRRNIEAGYLPGLPW
jgi:hypothetical protein